MFRSCFLAVTAQSGKSLLRPKEDRLTLNSDQSLFYFLSSSKAQNMNSKVKELVSEPLNFSVLCGSLSIESSWLYTNSISNFCLFKVGKVWSKGEPASRKEEDLDRTGCEDGRCSLTRE